MIIDKEQLISLLEEKTGHNRENVEDQLTELIKRIQKAAEEGKSFEIEGFGTFSMEEDSLQFEPTDRLETEINNKYAGMKPIELIGAFKEPEGDEVPEIDHDRIDIIDEERIDIKDKDWAFDKETAEEASEEPIPESDEETTDEEETETEEELVEQFESGQEPLTSEKNADEIFNMLGSMEDETTSSDILKEEAADETEGEPEKVADSREEKDIMGKWLIAAVIMIAIGLSGWVIYDTGLISEGNSSENVQEASSQLSSQQNQVNQKESLQEQSSQSSEGNNNSEPEEELSVGNEEDLQPIKESKEEESDTEAVFGLKGEINETVSSGYTIVVHSLRSLQVAEDRRNNLQESGYRTLISKADIQGTTYYRVGLGQFESVEDALQAVSDIPEPFQNEQNHFIKRIQ